MNIPAELAVSGATTLVLCGAFLGGMRHRFTSKDKCDDRRKDIYGRIDTLVEKHEDVLEKISNIDGYIRGLQNGGSDK